MAKKREKASSVRLDLSDAVFVDSIEGQRRSWNSSGSSKEARQKSLDSQERVIRYLRRAAGDAETEVSGSNDASEAQG